MLYEQVQALKPEAFKRYCGIHRSTFRVMVEVSEQKRNENKKPGRPAKLSLEDQLLLTLQYWREYRTYFHLAQTWQINESTAFRIVRPVEQTLIRSGRFSLPGKKALVQAASKLEVLVVDVTENPVERPKNQRRVYSGEKKRPTLKTQLVVNQKTGAIVCAAYCKGRTHDLRRFQSRHVRLTPPAHVVGEQGLSGHRCPSPPRPDPDQKAQRWEVISQPTASESSAEPPTHPGGTGESLLEALSDSV